MDGTIGLEAFTVQGRLYRLDLLGQFGEVVIGGHGGGRDEELWRRSPIVISKLMRRQMRIFRGLGEGTRP